MRFIIVLFFFGYISVQAQKPKVNQDRPENSILELAKFGLQKNGETQRVAFSDGDVKAQKWVMNTLTNLSIEVYIDFVGNIIGTRKGKNASLKTISFGSHIDLVSNDGNYNGCVGYVVSFYLSSRGLRSIKRHWQAFKMNTESWR